MTNILIGIGGTGAKCVEAFIHMCAAGIGPNDGSVWLEMVDQDQSNGNLNRTSQAFSLYSDLRNDLRLNNDHQLAGGCQWQAVAAIKILVDRISLAFSHIEITGNNPTVP